MAAVLRLYRLDAQSLWVDEAFTWQSARVGEPLALADLRETLHGPLYTLLMHAWTGVAGDSERALRLPSAVMGVALVAAVAWLAARVAGRAAAQAAAWLAAISPFLVWYSQEARTYTMTMVLATVATGLALYPATGGRLPGVRHAAAYTAALWAALLASLSTAFLLPLHLRALLARRGGWLPRAAALGLVVAGGALLLLPLAREIARRPAWHRLIPFAGAEVRAENLRGGPSFHWAALPYAALTFSTGYTLGPTLGELHRSPTLRTATRHAGELGLAGAGFGLLAMAGWVAAWRRRRTLDFALWLLLPALALSYLAVCNFKPFNPRYLAVCVPGFVVLLAMGFAELPRAWRALAGGLVLAACALSLHHHYFRADYGKEDFRSASALLAAQGSAGEVVVTAGTQEPLFYYYRGPLEVRRYWLGFAARPERMREKLVELLGDAQAAWIVLSRPEHWDPEGRFQAWLGEGFPAARVGEFHGVQVWRATRPEGGWTALPQAPGTGALP